MAEVLMEIDGTILLLFSLITVKLYVRVITVQFSRRSESWE